jgi:hypothetical protein
MISFIIHIFAYPFEPHSTTNKFGQLLRFLFKNYPAYFWSGPSLKKIAQLPFLIIYHIFKEPDKKINQE